MEEAAQPRINLTREKDSLCVSRVALLCQRSEAPRAGLKDDVRDEKHPGQGWTKGCAPPAWGALGLAEKPSLGPGAEGREVTFLRASLSPAAKHSAL